MAGIVDGDGCISTGTYKGRIRPRLTVSNNSEALMNWLVAKFGGSFYVKHNARGPRNTAYAWEVSYRKAEKALRLITPLLLIKKRQGELALVLQAMSKLGGRAQTPETREQRTWLAKQISRMNQAQ